MSMYLEICAMPLTTDVFYVWDCASEQVLFEGSHAACEGFINELFAEI